MHNEETTAFGQNNTISLVKTEYLNLGDNKNYKTKTIQNRWEAEREKWLNSKTKQDPRDGVPGEPLPMDNKKRAADQSMSVRKKVKMTMRSVTSPYEKFEAYYPLEEVIDTYMEIWYQSDSSDSSS